MAPPIKLGILGCGMMAEAILRRLFSQSFLQPDQVIASVATPTRQAWLGQTYGMTVTCDNTAVLQAPIILLGIKPQVFSEISTEFKRAAPGLVLSIVTGISLKTLAQVFPQRTVIRAVPNTPALVGAGITALATLPTISPAELDQAQAIFGVIGEVLVVPEKFLNSVTAIAGSGPAFIALMVEALMDGGVLVGLPRPIARKLVLATVTGTIKLLEEQNLHPGQLKDQVTSPGGTTITGLSVLEAAGVRGALIQTIEAAQAKATELGQLD